MNLAWESRFAALLIFVTVMILFDFKNPPEKRRRFKAYSFLLTIGAIGAVFGMLIDSITSRISLEYFISGKGLTDGPQLKRDILLLGAKAGFSGALMVACAFIIANPEKTVTWPLFQFIIVPLCFSVAFAIVLGIFQYATKAVTLEGIEFLLSEPQQRLFTTVWMTHIGLYLGGFIGLLLGCFQIREKLKLPQPLS